MNEENRPDDWRDNIAVVAIVDAALLSVIRAHQPLPGVKDEDERKRLNDPKTALFGFKKHRGRPKDQDTPELVHMARAYMEDRGQPKLDSDYKPMFTEVDQAETGYQTELARQAIAARKKADPAYKPHNEEEKIRNLQQKYAESRDELIRLVVDWFNNRRILQPIGNIPPEEAEEKFYEQRNEFDKVA